MTLQWFALGAHDGDALVCHPGFQAGDATAEKVRLGEERVAHAAVGVEDGGVLAASAEFFPQKYILDACGGERGL